MFTARELSKLVGTHKAELYTLRQEGVLQFTKLPTGSFAYSDTAPEDIQRYRDMIAAKKQEWSAEGILKCIDPWWSAEMFEYVDMNRDLTATCKTCGVTSCKPIRKYRAASTQGKSGCFNCHQSYAKTEEFAQKMGDYSAPAGSEPRQRQSENLKHYYQSLSKDEMAKTYGRPETEFKRTRRLGGYHIWYKNLSEEDKNKHWEHNRTNKDQIAKHVIFMKSWWIS